MIHKFIIFARKKGFVLLYALILVSVLLALALSISNVNVREYKLSQYGNESLKSFYAAESGLECALFWDLKTEKSAFSYDPLEPAGRDISCTGYTFRVGDNPSDPVTILQIDYPNSTDNAKITIDKTDNKTNIESRGYNTDDPNYKYAVERGLKVGYGDTETTDGLYDIILVVDNSNSIRLADDPLSPGENMQSLIDASELIINNYTNQDLGENGTKFSVIGFETSSFIQLHLSSNKNSIKSAINAMQSIGGTNTGGGFFLSEYEYANYGRDDAKKIIVLMTDGAGNTCVDSDIYTSVLGQYSGKSVVDGLVWCQPTPYPVDYEDVAAANSEIETRAIIDRLKDTVVGEGAYLIVVAIKGSGFYGEEEFNEDFLQEIADKYFFIDGFSGIAEITATFDPDFFERFVEDVDRQEF